MIPADETGSCLVSDVVIPDENGVTALATAAGARDRHFILKGKKTVFLVGSSWAGRS